MSPNAVRELVRSILNSAICGLKKWVLLQIAEIPSGGGGETSYIDDDSAPAMTQSALAASSGNTDIVYLTDRTGAKRWAVPNLNTDPDTTPATADSVIVDATGKRWYIVSQRGLANLQNKIFAFK